ncbi:hypothetical protein PYW08_004118 [Mythimna loreyi]|uniref:Uncharacterized protein n=1 Tax=Mythimna loreyi TaxID=667449 RepID=A0ACC2QWH4_9NEOP|nr:hypothetical protein PYW08_004118 [Mythimna loreyi]
MATPLVRRWQRRWFVLYDDGELTYSLDEHPDTVPQASIDMTTVLEVSEADSVTGHPFSLAITAPERVTFVKGTCREEARWWSDVLSVSDTQCLSRMLITNKMAVHRDDGDRATGCRRPWV